MRSRTTSITPERYNLLKAHLEANGFAKEVQWASSILPPKSAEDLACEAIWVILCSGMKAQVAGAIAKKVWPVIYDDKKPVTGSGAFGHKGKCKAIDWIWEHQEDLFNKFLALSTPREQLDFCESLPWIGGITKYHLAKNLGVNVAKPDRHLERVAALHGQTTEAFCEDLANLTGDRVTLVDTVIWRSCNLGLIRVDDGHLRHDKALFPTW